MRDKSACEFAREVAHNSPQMKLLRATLEQRKLNMTILHDECKSKTTPMTSDAVVELLANTLGEMQAGAGNYDGKARAILSALSNAGLAVLPMEGEL